MPETSDKNATNRRGFLKLAATTAPAAVAAAAAISGTATETEAAEPVAETRLQDTAHTRTFYATARF